jgi:multidrug efflux system membrane fusion protein
MKWLKMSVLVFCLASLFWYSACSSHKTNSPQNSTANSRGAAGAEHPVPVGVSAVVSRNVPVILAGLGTITPYNTVTVRSRVDGELVRVNFQEGQFVHKGDLLAVIDPRPFQAALEMAEGALTRDEALLRTSEINLQRAKALTNDGVMAVQQLNAQQAETGQYTDTIALDRAAVENAKVNLAYTQIRAPLSGRIGLRLVDPGNIVHATDQNGLLVITQMQPIAVIFTLPEDEIPEVVAQMRQEALPVQAYDSNDTTLLASGKLETIDNTIDPTTGTVRLKGIFDNKDSVLWPNQFVNVHLQLQTLYNATVVPASAIQHGQDNVTFVYVVDANNKAQMRNVQLKLTQGNLSVITDGLTPGERIVVDGQDRLQAGVTVEPTAPQNQPPQNAESTTPRLGPNAVSPDPISDQGPRNGSALPAPVGTPSAGAQQPTSAAAVQGTATRSVGGLPVKSTGHGRRAGRR